MKFIVGFIAGFLVASSLVAYAASTDISVERLWNSVFDSTNNVIRVVGQ
jgi:hypothetical protein